MLESRHESPQTIFATEPRAGMWDPHGWPDLSDVPSAGEFLKTHGGLPEPVIEVDAVVERDRETRLY
jgi:hypothetical protein